MSRRSRSAGHCRQDDRGVCLPDGRLEDIEMADVAAVHVQVDEAMQVAVPGKKLLAQTGMPADKIVQQLAHRGTARLDLFLVLDVDSEDGWYPDPRHLLAAKVGNSNVAGCSTGAPSPHAGQCGSRRRVTSLNAPSSASQISSRPTSGSPSLSRILMASVACSRPMTPGTTPKTPATEQPGASSGGGGVGYRHR